MEEQWKDIKGYEGYYQVSDHGRVKSLDRVVDHPQGPLRRKGKEVKFKGHKDDYDVVTLHKDSKRKNRMVHNLVLEEFVGPRPDGMETRHLDGNPKNNHVSNLAWGTPKENSHDIDRHGRRHNSNKTHCSKGHELSGDNLAFERGGKKRVCRECRREKDRRRYQREKDAGLRGTLNGDKTHCKNGHEFTPENTGVRTDHPGRFCKACKREREARRRNKA